MKSGTLLFRKGGFKDDFKKEDPMTVNIGNLKVVFLFFMVAVFLLTSQPAWSDQDLENQIDTIIDVLLPPDANDREVQNKKNTIRQILHKEQQNGENSLIDELLQSSQNSSSSGSNNNSILDIGAERIVDILNPHADYRTKKQQKATLITILDGALKRKHRKSAKQPAKQSIKQPVVTNKNSRNLEDLAELTVSDELAYRYRVENVVDDIENTEWVASGSHGKWLLLRWRKPVTIDSVLLQGRRQDISVHIWSSDLIFSDGSVIDYGPLDAAQLKEITVNKRNINWMKYFIRDGENNVGLSEIRVRGTAGKAVVKPRPPQKVAPNLAQKAKISTSSYINKKHSVRRAVDRNLQTEWISKKGLNHWLFLAWDRPVTIDYIKLKGGGGGSGRRAGNGFFAFSDGSVIPVDGFSGNRSKRIKCKRRNIYWVKYYIRTNRKQIALAEIEVVGNRPKKVKVPENLAQQATVRVSDQKGWKYRGENVTDRRLDTEWVARGARDKWVALQWPDPVDVETITITAGKGLNKSRIDNGIIILSDGSLLQVGRLEPGRPVTVDINREELDWLRFFVRDGRGKIGLAEIEVKEQ